MKILLSIGALALTLTTGSNVALAKPTISDLIEIGEKYSEIQDRQKALFQLGSAVVAGNLLHRCGVYSDFSACDAASQVLWGVLSLSEDQDDTVRKGACDTARKNRINFLHGLQSDLVALHDTAAAEGSDKVERIEATSSQVEKQLKITDGWCRK